MTTTATAPRTNIGSKHPELYETVATMAMTSDQAALAEGLSPLLIELVKIRVSQINGCAFCLRMHTTDSLAKGESQERLSVLPAWQETRYFDEQERSALALAEYITMIRDVHSNVDLYESAVEHLTPGQVSAVSWVAMSINTFNRIAITSSFKVGPTKQR
ncbi:carboxymuconolactone decarboxylase family protein [Arthrobacter sp. AL08]|uniref:carboxymuconolactone decarboxylase family protein n=1 Tax=unclassified Arthrobacter TaxID=235627 RepID=UPI002499D3BA|nr:MULTISPECIES: carboxymuconolactone decarboxylase family protein [unclassified Arthrobacter]MDI3243145.1 carboxymuconolactone decarboxylase family protein [Arthrobacter sp. AL05]MDI3279155.1 carboxymuconolactone decarboxylase family protein [Arthrobacter sp. AL08]